MERSIQHSAASEEQAKFVHRLNENKTTLSSSRKYRPLWATVIRFGIPYVLFSLSQRVSRESNVNSKNDDPHEGRSIATQSKHERNDKRRRALTCNYCKLKGGKEALY